MGLAHRINAFDESSFPRTEDVWFFDGKYWIPVSFLAIPSKTTFYDINADGINDAILTHDCCGQLSYSVYVSSGKNIKEVILGKAFLDSALKLGVCGDFSISGILSPNPFKGIKESKEAFKFDCKKLEFIKK